MPASGPTVRLPDAAWRETPELRTLVGTFAAAGAQVRFVGGCVRDTLAGRPVKDVDIATPLLPAEVTAILRAAGLKVVPTGIAHGTVTAVVNRHPFEITTLRRDVDTDGRHAVVAFTADWRADAARRDFTMNALSATPDGRVFDYFDGCADLAAGRVRFVGPASDRITEDYLRILRFFRFFAHYGRPPPDAEAVAACRGLAAHLSALSAERVRDETLKLLAAPDPSAAWRLMAETGVAREILGEDGDWVRLARLVAIEGEADPIRRLAALVADAATLPGLAARLKLTNADRDRLLAIAAAGRPDGLPRDAAEARRMAYALGREDLGRQVVRDGLLLAAAGAADPGPLLALRRALDGWTVPRFALAGRDAVGLGLCAGPQVGRVLRAVEDWWVAGGFAAGRDECLDELKRRIAAPKGGDAGAGRTDGL